MRRHFVGTVLIGAALAASVALQPARSQDRRQPKRVLVVTNTAGFRHSSIPVAAGTVRALGVGSGDWEVVRELGTPEQVAAGISAPNLRNIDLVVFANTTGNLNFTPEGKRAFYDWINNGGSFVGVHSATDTFHGDPDFLNLIRGEFQGHGPQVMVTVYNQDPSHPACKDLPAQFNIYDEIYEFKNWERSKVHMLLTMKQHPQTKAPGDFPVAWTNRVGRGRMFYTSLGHREDVYQANNLYLKHLNGGIRWALGLEKGDDSPGNPLR